MDPACAAYAIQQYAGKIKETANGSGGSARGQTRQTEQIQPQRRLEENGGVNVGKAARGFCEDQTKKDPNQKVAEKRGPTSSHARIPC